MNKKLFKTGALAFIPSHLSSLKKKKKLLDFLIIALFLVIATQFIISSISRLSKGPAQDFAVFYLAGKQFLTGKNPYQKIGTEIIKNPPPAMFAFAPLGLLPITLSEKVYFVLSFLAFLATSYILLKAVNKNPTRLIQRHWKLTLIYLSLSLRFFPLRHNLASGQVNNFLLLLLTLAFYYQINKKEFLSSLMLAFAIVLKLTPALFFITLLIQKKLKSLSLLLLNLVTITLATLFITGTSIFKTYLSITKSFLKINPNYYNQALTGLLSRISSNLVLPGYLLLLLLCIPIFLYLRKYLGKKNFMENTILWNSTILAMLILPSFAWQYHFVIAIFPLFLTTFLLIKTKLAKQYLLLVGISYLLLAWNFKDPSIFDNLGILKALILSHATLGALLLLTLNLHLLPKTSQLSR
jgi:hypothetical protein